MEDAVKEIPLTDIDRSLSSLWQASSRSEAHASAFTLVAFCGTPDELPRARAALPTVVATHPCRTITVACYEGAPPSITARAGLHVDTRAGLSPIGEDLDLDVRGDARAWIPTTLARMRLSDVPLYVWWVGDLPDNDRLFDHFLEMADVAVVHTSDMDLRDLEALTRLLSLSAGEYVIADLTWMRLRTWQEFTARFFDDPDARALIPSLRTLSISLTPREREREPVSTQAALFAGWCCEALGWSTASPAWRVEGDVAVATLTDRRGEAVTLRFETLDKEGVYPGAIQRVELSGAEARFEVCRSDDDAGVLCWSAEVPGVVMPSQCVRIGAPEEPKMLSRTLEAPRRDRLFERSLASAARLIAPVATRPR
jgi:glucose-6-phosphate dehydrogenase assembly protein OpcA